MKRLIVFLVSCMLPLALTAQVSLSSGTPNIDVKIKRCFAKGNDVYVDFLMTSNGKWSQIVLKGDVSKAFDDEGNMYKGGFMGGHDFRYGISFEYDRTNNASICFLEVPRDVPRKVRMKITDVDEYATKFITMTIDCTGDNSSANPFVITIKNLPIQRE